jgi:hypothetical protein
MSPDAITNIQHVSETVDGPRLWAVFDLQIRGLKLIERGDGDFFVVAPSGMNIPGPLRDAIGAAAVAAIGIED